MSDTSATPEEQTSEAVVAFRVMNVESVLFDLHDSSPMVHLIEAEAPFRYLAIPIALPEAVALNNALTGVTPRRPGTHDIAHEVLKGTQTDVIAARIVRLENGVYFAELDLMTPKGRLVLDCRTSDAINFALRQVPRAPVLCASEVLEALYS